MGKQARRMKARTCTICRNHFYLDARELAGHAALCKRAHDVGLVIPQGIIAPSDYKIIRLPDD